MVMLKARNLAVVVKIFEIAVPNRHQELVAPMETSKKTVIRMPISDENDPASVV
jgi:hypothetical protein